MDASALKSGAAASRQEPLRAQAVEASAAPTTCARSDSMGAYWPRNQFRKKIPAFVTMERILERIKNPLEKEQTMSCKKKSNA